MSPAVVGSGFSRIFSFGTILAGLILSPFASPVLAQTVGSERTTVGSTFGAELISALPTSDNLFQLLETTQPTLVSDRFLGGGLYAGQAARVGGFLGSWSQTLFRVGDVSLTDPRGSGAPLLFPDLALWSAVDVATGMIGADLNATGLAISLEPRRPTATWVRTVELTASHFGTSAFADPPAVARLDGWDRATVVASGPIVADRLGLTLAGAWIRASQLERADPSPVTYTLTSGFAHLVFTPTDRDEIRTIGWLQHTTAPFEHRLPFNQHNSTIGGTSGHAQSTWEHGGPGAVPWRFFAGYTAGHQALEYDPPARVVFERLRDGPLSAIPDISTGTVYRWSVGSRVGGQASGARSKRHVFQGGVDADGGGARASSFFSGDVRELVDAVPARVWRFTNPGIGSFRHEIGVSAYVSDRIAIAPPVTLDAAVRYDSVSGSAEGAATSVRWGTLLPRGALRWTIGDRWQPTLVVGYARAAYRLPLDWLAVGDPAAPRAEIFRWNAGSATTVGPLVARQGPGTGGDPDFTRIDPDLRRPEADEFVVGLELRPRPDFFLRVTGVRRTERDLVGLVNDGRPAYAIAGVFDPGADLGSPEDDRLVPIYNRLPESFGRDRYLLTNLELRNATFAGIELSAQLTNDRFFLLLGATAGRAETSVANRGFGPLENDQGLVGELAADPNAGTFARGRPFSDRAYTAKVVSVYRFGKATTLGLVARYQDGQPFSRMLVVPALNQGAEAVRAFPSGDSRFMFVGTLDVRLQKGFTVGSRRIDVVLDAYNLLDLSNSVEERTTSAPDVRVATLVQPPRTVHLGLRLGF